MHTSMHSSQPDLVSRLRPLTPIQNTHVGMHTHTHTHAVARTRTLHTQSNGSWLQPASPAGESGGRQSEERRAEAGPERRRLDMMSERGPSVGGSQEASPEDNGKAGSEKASPGAREQAGFEAPPPYPPHPKQSGAPAVSHLRDRASACPPPPPALPSTHIESLSASAPTPAHTPSPVPMSARAAQASTPTQAAWARAGGSCGVTRAVASVPPDQRLRPAASSPSLTSSLALSMGGRKSGRPVQGAYTPGSPAAALLTPQLAVYSSASSSASAAAAAR